MLDLHLSVLSRGHKGTLSICKAGLIGCENGSNGAKSAHWGSEAQSAE